MRVSVASVFILALIAGCASRRAESPSTLPAAQVARSAAATTRSAADARASLTLDQITPKPVLPVAKPATSPSRPPVEALELYARARDAIATGNRFTAVSLLERAISLDPNSAEPYRLLARAQLLSGQSAKAIDALRRACELEPNDGRSQTALGRLYLLRNDAAAATERLRLSLQTKAYSDDEATAAVTDFFLARALQQQGYDQAALEEYEKLMSRLRRPTLALRSDAELTEWLARPATIWGDVARLYERRGDNAAALQLWQLVVQHDSEDFDARAHVVGALLVLDRRDEALAEAAETVRLSRASARSIDLLRDVANKLGRNDALYEELRRVQQQNPQDRAVLFAIVSLLCSDGRDPEAEKLLVEAARQKWDAETVRKLCSFYADRRRSDEAAALIIEASAARPGDTPQLLELFVELMRPLRPDAVRAATIQKLNVPEPARAAKLYFLARAALAGSRYTTLREALSEAVLAEPAFPPAYWLQMQLIWQHGTSADPAAQQRDADALLDRAAKSGVSGLADSIRGLMLFTQSKRPEAAAALESAIRAKTSSPEPAMLLATIQLDQQETTRFEQTLWRVISDHPEFAPAYVRLINFYLNGNPNTARNVAAATQVLQKWLAADPSSIDARLAEAVLFTQGGYGPDALRAMQELAREHPADFAVLQQARAVYLGANQSSQYLAFLEELADRSPANVVVAQELLQSYLELHRQADVNRTIERVQSASKNDARLLVVVAQLYTLADDRQKSQRILEEALRLDPLDPGVNNDLGYTWADEGKNLERSEAMIRRAVEAEPDNPSFLDSLGWVLYKRGQFDEAKKQLLLAVESDESVDSVMLDHLGDTLYRLNDVNGARNHWQRALERIATTGRDAADIRSAVEGKLRQQAAGEPVNVAPIAADPAAKPAQANSGK